MSLAINLVMFLITCLFLIGSGTVLVKSLTTISKYLRISEFTVGFIIMAVATTMPELFVGITSALSKKTGLAVGTVIGSNIVNLTLIAGIMILLSKGNIKIHSRKTKSDALHMVYIAALPIVLFIIGNSISRIDGMILISVFMLTSWRIFKKGKKFTKELEDGTIKRMSFFFSNIIFVLSLAALFLSAKYVVKYATMLSEDLALPPIMIGLFLVALGTSLPELAFSSRAALMGHPEMAVGDLIGACIVNSTLVLGVTAIIFPITADISIFFVSAIFMLLVCFIFAAFIASGLKLDLNEGISLILLYVFFLIVEFYMKGIKI